MKFKGKLIGAALGLILGGPIGLVLGFIAGHLFDIGYFQAIFQAAKGNIHTHSQQIFFNNTFKIMGYIAKSDGRVSENEIKVARQIMAKMGLNEELKQHAMRLFTEGKNPDFQLGASLQEIRHVCRLQPLLMQIFLDVQLQMASADGQLPPAKKATLQHICDYLGVSGYQFHTNEQYDARQSHMGSLSLDHAHHLLGVSKTPSFDEIKKAYRKLMNQNHPDKLIAKGLPPEMIKVATEKTQQIKQAYEMLKKARGF